MAASEAKEKQISEKNGHTKDEEPEETNLVCILSIRYCTALDTYLHIINNNIFCTNILYTSCVL